MNLVLGASGFVGLRLVRALAEAGRPVRGLCRSELAASLIKDAGGTPIRGDLVTGQGVDDAFAGVGTVYYLVHSLRGGTGFEERDAAACDSSLAVAKRHQISRFVYVGGLGAHRDAFSPHLRSRYRVEEQIRGSGIPFTIFRTGSILGRGGASFQVMRDVVFNLPIVPILNWQRTPMQPIGANDLMRYLLTAPELDGSRDKTFDLGCSETMTYSSMLHLIAELSSRRLWALQVPGFLPYLSGIALRFTSSVPPNVVKALIPGLREPMVCRDRSADTVFGFEPAGVREALAIALAEFEE